MVAEMRSTYMPVKAFCLHVERKDVCEQLPQYLRNRRNSRGRKIRRNILAHCHSSLEGISRLPGCHFISWRVCQLSLYPTFDHSGLPDVPGRYRCTGISAPQSWIFRSPLSDGPTAWNLISPCTAIGSFALWPVISVKTRQEGDSMAKSVAKLKMGFYPLPRVDRGWLAVPFPEFSREKWTDILASIYLVDAAVFGPFDCGIGRHWSACFLIDFATLNWPHLML